MATEQRGVTYKRERAQCWFSEWSVREGGEMVLGSVLHRHNDSSWWWLPPLTVTGVYAWEGPHRTRRAATDALLADSDAGAERERTET